MYIIIYYEMIYLQNILIFLIVVINFSENIRIIKYIKKIC